MNNWPKISIITPTYNSISYLESSIKSVINQNYPNLEYIIIDGGSTDGTVDIIRKYSDNISYWVSEPDKGQTHALNKGFKQATGVLRAWLNSDEEYMPETLKSIALEYLNDNHLDLIYGDRYFLDLTKSPAIKTIEKIPTITPYALILYTGRILCTDATFWTNDVHKRIGELNEAEYPKLAMDVEWLLRVAGASKNSKYIPKPLSIFKSHGMNATTLGLIQGSRLNEKIRRDYAKNNNIPIFKLGCGWLWYSVKLRYFEKGIKGLFLLPKWDTLSSLFFK